MLVDDSVRAGDPGVYYMHDRLFRVCDVSFFWLTATVVFSSMFLGSLGHLVDDGSCILCMISTSASICYHFVFNGLRAMWFL